MLKRLFDLFLFSSFYIAVCAVVMVHQTRHLLQLTGAGDSYLFFVFFSTVCSYNFHWYLTPASETEVARTGWTQKNRKLHLWLFITGLAGSAWYFIFLAEHWFWISGAVLLTFLYSAPKLPVKTFWLLRKIAIGKTTFLAFVWTYVTSLLPVLISGTDLTSKEILFCISRFFLIYSICIIFDYRDRQHDKEEGIRSMITYFNEKGINRLFYTSLALFAISTVSLHYAGFATPIPFILLVPGAITLFLYNVARRNFSDYLYYFVLDGLMMLSALFTSFISI